MNHEHPEAVAYAAAAPELAKVNDDGFEPITFRIHLREGREGARSEYTGFIVPGTDGLLAIDERYQGDEDGESVWWITHLPTGVRVSMYPHTLASTKARAAQIAQQFFRQYTGRGWSLAGNDAQAIANCVRNLPPQQRAAFWAAVAAL